jgi:hypothetical protein
MLDWLLRLGHVMYVMSADMFHLLLCVKIWFTLSILLSYCCACDCETILKIIYILNSIGNAGILLPFFFFFGIFPILHFRF